MEAGDSATAGQPEEGNNKSDEVNLIKQYQAKWSWWNDLHSIWSQRPNFNPIGIENAQKGRNHVEEFHQLLDDTQLVEDSISRQNENQELRLSQRSISDRVHDGYETKKELELLIALAKKSSCAPSLPAHPVHQTFQVLIT